MREKRQEDDEAECATAAMLVSPWQLMKGISTGGGVGVNYITTSVMQVYRETETFVSQMQTEKVWFGADVNNRHCSSRLNLIYHYRRRIKHHQAKGEWSIKYRKSALHFRWYSSTQINIFMNHGSMSSVMRTASMTLMKLENDQHCSNFSGLNWFVILLLIFVIHSSCGSVFNHDKSFS